MNRRYIVICSFFIAFFVLSAMCYGSFQYAQKQEEKKLLDTLLMALTGTTILLATHRRQAIRRAAQVIEVIP